MAFCVEQGWAKIHNCKSRILCRRAAESGSRGIERIEEMKETRRVYLGEGKKTLQLIIYSENLEVYTKIKVYFGCACLGRIDIQNECQYDLVK